MIVVDASALLAIYLNEPERTGLTTVLEAADTAIISPVNYWEVVVRARSLDHEEGAIEATRLVESLGVEIVSIDAEIANMAIEAFARYGTAPARLNLGDCFAYALAKLRNAPLLYKGNDFIATDIAAA